MYSKINRHNVDVEITCLSKANGIKSFQGLFFSEGQDIDLSTDSSDKGLKDLLNIVLIAVKMVVKFPASNKSSQI